MMVYVALAAALLFVLGLASFSIFVVYKENKRCFYSSSSLGERVIPFISIHHVRTKKESENRIAIRVECKAMEVEFVRRTIVDLVNSETESLNHFKQKLKESLDFIPDDKIKMVLY